MSTFTAEVDREVVGGEALPPAAKPLMVVVGYDGTESSRHALDGAIDLLERRTGELHVVYVAHVPASVRLASEAIPDIQATLDELTNKLAGQVQARLAGSDIEWRFERRDGAVDVELTAAADNLHARYGDDARVVIVVGGPEQWFHHLAGSVPTGVIRHDRFPVIVVPTSQTS